MPRAGTTDIGRVCPCTDRIFLKKQERANGVTTEAFIAIMAHYADL